MLLLSFESRSKCRIVENEEIYKSLKKHVKQTGQIYKYLIDPQTLQSHNFVTLS